MHKKVVFLTLLILTLLLSGCTITIGDADSNDNKEINTKTSDGTFKIGEVIYEQRNETFSFGGFVSDSIVINVTTGGVNTEISYALFIYPKQKVQLPNTDTFIYVTDIYREEGEIVIEFSENK